MMISVPVSFAVHVRTTLPSVPFRATTARAASSEAGIAAFIAGEIVPAADVGGARYVEVER